MMVVYNTPIYTNNVLIENDEGLGAETTLQHQEKIQDKEINRRLGASWATYAKDWDLFSSNLAIYLKRCVYYSCVLPAMTYGAETLTKQAQNKLAAAHSKTERNMLSSIIIQDRKVVLGMARDVNRFKDDHLETVRQETTTRETSQAGRYDLNKYRRDTIWQRTT